MNEINRNEWYRTTVIGCISSRADDDLTADHIARSTDDQRVLRVRKLSQKSAVHLCSSIPFSAFTASSVQKILGPYSSTCTGLARTKEDHHK